MNYLVIGGAKGVGAATVELLEAQGNTVYFTSREASSYPNSIVWNIEDESLNLPEGSSTDWCIVREQLTYFLLIAFRTKCFFPI